MTFTFFQRLEPDITGSHYLAYDNAQFKQRMVSWHKVSTLVQINLSTSLGLRFIHPSHGYGVTCITVSLQKNKLDHVYKYVF